MTESEARKALRRWRSWAARVNRRWSADSPMVDLAHRRVLEAELRLREIHAADRFQ